MDGLPSLDLKEKRALVIGGAGGGIGSAVTMSLLSAGADVAVITVDERHAEQVVAEGVALGKQIRVQVADVTEEKAFADALDQVLTESGPIEHLVNVVGGAGITDWSRAKDYQLETFDRILSRNLRYALVSCQRIASALVDASLSGSIVNISSIATRAVPLLAGYGAAKAGLESLSRTFAAEWGQYGIRVNVVAPGTVKTPRAGKNDLEEASKKIPLQRRAEPEDIANAVLFLLSERAQYITGQTLVVDGGATLGASGDNLPVFVTNPEVRKQFE